MSCHCIQTKVTGIDVYLQGAIVYRQGTIQLAAGENEFCLSGLPSKVDTSSIHLKFSGQVSHCRILDCEPEPINKDDLPEGQQLKKIKQSLFIEERNIAGLKAAEDAWTKNSDFTGRPNITLEQSMNYIQQLPERISELSAKIIEHEDVIEKLKNEKQKLEQKIERIISDLKNSVRVDVQVPAAGEYPFELSYEDPHVYWLPFYEIWMKGLNVPLQIQMRARVLQTTGEDWENVGITLFYGHMNQSGDQPVLKPWYVSRHNPLAVSHKTVSRQLFCPNCGSPVVSGFCPNCGAKVPYSPAAATSGVPERMIMAEPEIGEGIVSEDIFSRYDLLGRYVIPSGKDGIIVDVLNFQLPAAYEYCAVPKKDEGAYLTAHISDASQYELLPCQGDLFVENTKVGTVNIEKEPAMDMVLSLGKERRIQISRKVLKDFHGVQRFKNVQVHTIEYEIYVKNTKNEPVSLLVKDQIPLSKDKEILVEIREVSGGTIDETSGEVGWKLFLNPGQAQTLRLAFSVTYPKGENIFFNH
ncbi:MAG TPA: mucoidy inhibitor MuiA family protein [Candidatus Scybalocola faecavium]|nr:mucoidy inhibitor MuiA family protein [Candidatus Scybalocola faecavium]